MTHAFDRTIELEDLAPGRFRAQVDESWYQGRGAYGGVLGGWFAEAFRKVVAPTRRPRSLTVQFAAPIKTTPVTLGVEVVREGTYISHLSGRAVQDDQVVGFAIATYGAPRHGAVSFANKTAPRMNAPYRDVPAINDSPLMPAFCRHFEYRFASGALPFTGSTDDVRLGGYVNFLPSRPLDYPGVVALLDAWPPTAITAITSPGRGGASIDFTIHFYVDLPRPQCDGIAVMELESLHAEGGYADERAFLFATDGTCIAEARQLVALIP